MFLLGILLSWNTVASALPPDAFHRLELFYRDIHQHPELSGDERRTAQKVAARFRDLGLDVMEGVGGHGVIGTLKNGEGPISLVRAEMDALPIHEDTRLPFKSVIDGKMHACGHDFHLASLLGVAAEMSQNKKAWKGSVIFVAQPAEEVNKGAKAIVSDSRFQKLPRATHTLAMHSAGVLKSGHVSVTLGNALAAVDAIDVHFRGRGTHGAMPEAGVDPFVMTAEFILKMQTLVGREKSATEPVVISVGSVHGGNKRNIIPEDVKISLTVRSYNPEVRDKIKKRIRDVAFGIAKTNAAPDPIFEIRQESGATVNDPEWAQKALDLLKKEFGEKAVEVGRPSMAGEDFGEFGRFLKARSLYFAVGVGGIHPTHSPKYAPDFKKDAPIAIRAMTAVLHDLHAL